MDGSSQPAPGQHGRERRSREKPSRGQPSRGQPSRGQPSRGQPSPRRHGPAHPPFTHYPLAAYVFAAGFDVASAVAGGRHAWAGQFWRASTFVLIAGLAICLVTMGTGFWDLVRYWRQASPAASSVAAHVCVMAAAFMIGTGDIAWRLSDYSARASTPPGVAALSLAAAAVACSGAYIGGRLVFAHAIGVQAVVLPSAAPPGAEPPGAAPPGTVSSGTVSSDAAARESDRSGDADPRPGHARVATGEPPPKPVR
jgi:uncharacterized membrane protein